SERVNKSTVNLVFDYTYNDANDPNRFYYRSDHYNFARNNIPVIFYFSGTHVDYHQPTDTIEKIQFDKLRVRTQLVFYTAWEIANQTETIEVD
ncbi:MAG: M28 family peptidase, partial [Cyclobacteriaceae bacterium]|nr:M28 family peptidase [Cyclobacteriaceae bacterium]